MAIISQCHFSLWLRGDGSSTSVSVEIATAPFSLGSVDSNPFQPSFSLAILAPSSVKDVASSNGIAVTATLSLGAITFDFASAPPLSSFSVSGYFEF